MNQELQEKAWSLLPELAKDLHKFKNHDPASSSVKDGSAFKSLDLKQPGNFDDRHAQ